jgi:hypothetical protein
MRKQYSFYSFLLFIVAGILLSCSSGKKVQSRRDAIVTVDSQLVQNKNALAQLDQRRKNKQSQNEIDDTASSRIQKFITKAKAEIDNTVNKNMVLIGETAVDREDWNKLKKALTESQKSLKNIKDKVAFINDLLKRNTVVKLDQDVIFGPGQYEVTPEVAAAIGSFFEPAAKEIDTFIKKYPSFPLSLVITAKGYADGTTIAEGTDLYKSLKLRLRLQTDNPDNKDLNKELSTARAERVIELFKQFTTDRSGKGNAIRNILYLYEGKGEVFPNPKVTDYKTDDPRRRVVLLFWSVFPD